MEKKYWLTDEQVEAEIERLNNSEAVALARREERLNNSETVALARRKARLEYRRRQYLYQLRDLEKKGRALLDAGITREVLDQMYEACDESEEN